MVISNNLLIQWVSKMDFGFIVLNFPLIFNKIFSLNVGFVTTDSNWVAGAGVSAYNLTLQSINFYGQYATLYGY